MPQTLIGLMSGTSLDGVDAVLVQFDPRIRLLQTEHMAYGAGLKKDLLALLHSGPDELHRSALITNQITDLYAECIAKLLARTNFTHTDISAIGCHGQTVRHKPELGYSLQLMNGARLAEATHIPVICDFRSRDIAAGGQGAPLVPAFHRLVFGSHQEHRCIINIGGIANITDLPIDEISAGFDCGPGNALMDEWTQKHRGEDFDRDGQWASQGKVLAPLLETWLAHEFFHHPPPKSSGRDTFNLHWALQFCNGLEAAVDIQATLLELTVRSICQALQSYCQGVKSIFICGGGARNKTLMHRLTQLCPLQKVQSTSALGIDEQWVEALAFAWLALQNLNQRPANVAALTGARGERILGAIYPA